MGTCEPTNATSSWLKYLVCCQTLTSEQRPNGKSKLGGQRSFSPQRFWHFSMRLYLLTGPPMPMCSNFQSFKWCFMIFPKGGISPFSMDSQGNNLSSECISAFSLQYWLILYKYIMQSLFKIGIQECFHFLTSLYSKYLCSCLFHHSKEKYEINKPLTQD